MYLYVWLNGDAKLVFENPTAGDMMGVASATLRIFRIKGETIEQLTIQEGRASWDELKEAKVVYSKDFRIHTP